MHPQSAPTAAPLPPLAPAAMGRVKSRSSPAPTGAVASAQAAAKASRALLEPAGYAPTLARLANCERGAASTEYLVVLCLVTLGAALCIAHWGPGLLNLYWMQRAFLSLPFP